MLRQVNTTTEKLTGSATLAADETMRHGRPAGEQRDRALGAKDPTKLPWVGDALGRLATLLAWCRR